MQISGYLGSSDAFDEAIATFAERYAAYRTLAEHAYITREPGSGTREVVDVVRLAVRAPFAATDVVLRLLDAAALERAPFVREAPEFDGDGLIVHVTLAVAAAEELREELREATHGGASVEVVE